MAEPVVLPAMGTAQQQSWHALMELYERINHDWTLIGGQLVHLHCAERGASPTRPTNDVDTVVDIRASPTILTTFTGALMDLGFTADISGAGIQHRWRRDHAQIDVLIPEDVGRRAAARAGAAGGTGHRLTRHHPGAAPQRTRDDPDRRQDRLGPAPQPRRSPHRQGRSPNRDRLRPGRHTPLHRLRRAGRSDLGSRLPGD